MCDHKLCFPMLLQQFLREKNCLREAFEFMILIFIVFNTFTGDIQGEYKVGRCSQFHCLKDICK